MAQVDGVRRAELAASAIVFDGRARVLLIRENYGHRRYGLPGGSVELGESPWAAAVREATEETTLAVAVRHLVAVCAGPLGRRAWVVHFAFLCDRVAGEASVPEGDEIAEVGWYPPDQWPEPRTVMGPLLLAAALRGERGAYLDGPRPGEEPVGSVWPPER
jgi:ADP-ribose pyrophosphatase YjhB (NUDIX family)